ncbi:MAG TPA: lytic transglycosylase F [Desulfofustis sp.]|jgi:membrane-bound lytic murein transglycosylase MltF|nr:lytic transglycosylase F [Desulfofustis sp. PB-SRB1]HBH29663.1 lytic transglycosylase F [Desulfofustis sp.]HBH31752.1 lytic transglycosylase F [Desulfofustis sp.]
MNRSIFWAICFMIVSATACTCPADASTALSTDLSVEQLERLIEPFTGDLEEMVEDRIIRVLVPYSRTFFFFDGLQPRGVTFEALEMFDKFVNESFNTGTLRVDMLYIPTTRDQLITKLIEGKGDIAAGNLTISDDRLALVDFSDPLATGIDEILVTSADHGDVTSVFELGGKEIYVRKSSSYYESLEKLNETMRSMGKAEVVIVEADENLEDEDLLEMVNASLIDYTVIDFHKGELWAQVFDNITLHPGVKFRTDGAIGWAFRKDSPQLKGIVNEFMKGHKVGTTMGNILIKRYLMDASYITDEVQTEHLQRFANTIDYFKKYGSQYDFPYLMLAALAYQESQLDHSARSAAGAVGIMQLLPSTAQDENVGIPNIEELDPNIHAGTKYLRFLIDRYFADDPNIDETNQVLFAFAAYNAGPARVARLRKEAAETGLDANRWFRNVELIAAKRIGRETVQYVANIFKYYLAYQTLEKNLDISGSIESRANGPSPAGGAQTISGPKKKLISNH